MRNLRRGQEQFRALVQDPFGNYVIQKIIDSATPEEKRWVCNVVRSQADVLESLSFGKHILDKLG